MKTCSFVALVAGAWLASAASIGCAAEAAKDELQGVWAATSMEINGEPAPAKEVGRTRFAFKGEKLLLRHSKDGGKEVEATFKADPKKSPRHLDITIRNKTLYGIYEVKGDELKVCYETGDKPENRPAKFATNKEEELVLIVFKRQKPEYPAEPATAALREDLKALAGTWVPVSIVADGRKLGDKELNFTVRYEASGKFSVHRDGKVLYEMTLKIDPSKKPKAIDYRQTAEGENKGKGVLVLGIYEVEGGRLRVCTMPEGKGRPAEFSSDPGSGHYFRIYKREKE
jgi:uncharacterized protein (TIGR03067 family)